MRQCPAKGRDRWVTPAVADSAEPLFTIGQTECEVTSYKMPGHCCSKGSGQMAHQRTRINHIKTFAERLEEEAHKFRDAAEQQPPGSMARELLLRRAQMIEASQVNPWLKIRRPAGEAPAIRPK
jgi:hypothetical protein